MKEEDPSIEEKYSFFDKLLEEIRPVKGEYLSRLDVIDALFIINHDLYHLETPLDIWDLNLNLEDTKHSLINFDFSILRNTVEVSCEIIPRRLLVQEKVRIKQKGSIWIIHRNDKDPFPSQPHAHQLGSNLKMDLTTGMLYQKRKKVGSIRKKDLVEIRRKATELNFQLPKMR